MTSNGMGKIPQMVSIRIWKETVFPFFEGRYYTGIYLDSKLQKPDRMANSLVKIETSQI
jgi:hypothetical protein